MATNEDEGHWWSTILCVNMYKHILIELLQGKQPLYASVNYAIISSNNGLLPVGPQPLFEPMLASC